MTYAFQPLSNITPECLVPDDRRLMLVMVFAPTTMLSRDSLCAPWQTLLGAAGGAVRRLSAYANVPSFHRLPTQKPTSAGTPTLERHGEPVPFAAMARAGQDGDQ